MNKLLKLIPFLVMSVACGSVEDDTSQKNIQKEVPAYCYTHPVKSFLEHYVKCNVEYPEFYGICAFSDDGTHRDQIQVRAGDPDESFECACDDTGHYECAGDIQLP